MGRRAALTCLVVALAGCTNASSTATSPISSSSSPSSSVPPSTKPPASPEPPLNLTVDVPKPGALISAFGSLWVQEKEDGSVWRIDDGKVVAKIPGVIRSKHLGWESFTLDAGLGSVWALGDGSVARIDPDTNKTVSRIEVPNYAYGLAVGAGGVWVACCAGGPPGSGIWPRLIRIDPTTETASLFAKQLTSPSSFAVGNGFVWWGNFSEAGSMQRIDAQTGAQVRIEAGNMRFIVPTPKWIWLLSGGSVQRVAAGSSGPAKDAGRKAPTSIGIVHVGGTVWINAGDAIAFDADTGKVGVRISLHRQSYQATGGIAKLGSRIWVADPAREQIVGAPLDT